jgi:hypothetical protein
VKIKQGAMERKSFWQYFALVLPGFVIFTIGLILPVLLAGYYSLTSWDGMSATKEFVGIRNYIKLFQDQNFLDSFWFTIKFTVGNTVIQNVLALKNCSDAYRIHIINYMFASDKAYNGMASIDALRTAVCKMTLDEIDELVKKEDFLAWLYVMGLPDLSVSMATIRGAGV